MVVPQVGRLVANDDPWEPYRLLDPDGLVVEPVSAWLRDLQAAGRSALTARSYGMDLLRWFRFLWAAGGSWDRATRIEARDFCRWLQVAGKPSRPHWRHQHEPGSAPGIGAVSGTAYSASVRAHSETVLLRVGAVEDPACEAPARQIKTAAAPEKLSRKKFAQVRNTGAR